MKLFCLELIFILFIFFPGKYIANAAEIKLTSHSVTELRSPEIQATRDFIIYHFNNALNKYGNQKEAHLRDSLTRHFSTLRLMKNGRFQGSFSGKEDLFLKNTTRENYIDFIHEVAYLTDLNPYIRHMLHDLSDDAIAEHVENTKKMDSESILNAVTYAMALEKVTHYFKHNLVELDEMDAIWGQELKCTYLFKHLSFFEYVKYYSVSLKGMAESTVTGQVDPDHLAVALPANILEATLSDFFSGFTGNAYTGWTLAKNGPGRSEVVPAAKVVEMPDSYRAVESCCPKAKEWADLYGAWNLAFVLRYPNFPYFISKLLIPSVLRPIQSHPETYMFHRAIPLYFQLRFLIFTSIDKSQERWGNPLHIPITLHHVGKRNQESAKLYKAL